MILSRPRNSLLVLFRYYRRQCSQGIYVRDFESLAFKPRQFCWAQAWFGLSVSQPAPPVTHNNQGVGCAKPLLSSRRGETENLCFALLFFLQGLEVKVRDMHARYARLARGGPVEDLSPTAAAVGGGNAALNTGEGREARGNSWVEAGVKEATAAMEAGRRRALEKEIEG